MVEGVAKMTSHSEDKRHSRGPATPTQQVKAVGYTTSYRARSRKTQAPISAACPRCGREREHDGIGYRCECAKVEIAGVTNV
jgi:hypothetical protein